MMNRMAEAAGAALMAVSGAALADYQLNLRAAASHVASAMYDLQMLMLGICFVVFIGVFLVMFYSIWAHRKSVGDKAEQFHKNIAVEILWTTIPAVILIFMAWPATKTLLSLKDTSNPELTIKATGLQWKWGYDYVKGEGEGISLPSNLSAQREQITGAAPKGEHYLPEVDNHVVVPVNK